MPQNRMNYEGRRGEARYNTCKANGQIQRTGLVNGAATHNGYPAAATRPKPRDSTAAETLKDAAPQYMVNGYFNYGYNGKSRRAPPPRTLRKQGGMMSAVADASAAAGVSREASSGGIYVNRTTGLYTSAVSHKCEKKAPEPSLPAAEKRPRGWKKFERKKSPPRMPPKEEEDWENEIQEVTITDWGKMCFGVAPYGRRSLLCFGPSTDGGPEDVLHFALRDLTLKQRSTVPPPVTANYSPAVHHRPPVKWAYYNLPTETDQFADADE